MRGNVDRVDYDYNINDFSLGLRIICCSCGHTVTKIYDEVISRSDLNRICNEFDYHFCSECGKKYNYYVATPPPDFLLEK